jgi:hypothetical protein
LHQAADRSHGLPLLAASDEPKDTGAARGLTLTTRLALAMILLVAIAVLAVGWLSYRNLERAVLPRVLDRIETHATLLAADLQSYVRGARGDVASFRSAAALNGMIRAHLAGGIDPVDGLSEKTWHDRMAERLVAELKAKPSYAQFRILGIENGGREILRVDRSGPTDRSAWCPIPNCRQRRTGPISRTRCGCSRTRSMCRSWI